MLLTKREAYRVEAPGGIGHQLSRTFSILPQISKTSHLPAPVRSMNGLARGIPPSCCVFNWRGESRDRHLARECILGLATSHCLEEEENKQFSRRVWSRNSSIESESRSLCRTLRSLSSAMQALPNIRSKLKPFKEKSNSRKCHDPERPTIINNHKSSSIPHTSSQAQHPQRSHLNLTPSTHTPNPASNKTPTANTPHTPRSEIPIMSRAPTIPLY